MQEDDANDPILSELRGLIERYGWAVRHVGESDSPAFSYTAGLTALNHPELIMVGMPAGPAQGFLNLLGADVRDGARFQAGETTWDLTDPPSPIAFIDAEDVSGLTAVRQVFGDVRALQVIWSDSQGKLPWDKGYRNASEAQPFLGALPDSFA